MKTCELVFVLFIFFYFILVTSCFSNTILDRIEELNKNKNKNKKDDAGESESFSDVDFLDGSGLDSGGDQPPNSDLDIGFGM